MKKNSKAQHIPLGFFQEPIGRMIPILKQKKVSKVAHWDFSDPKDACQKLELCTIESSEKIGSPGACRCRWFAGLSMCFSKKHSTKKKKSIKTFSETSLKQNIFDVFFLQQSQGLLTT